MDYLRDFILKPYESYSALHIFLESFAAFLGFLSVYFSSRNSIWVFPTGILNTAIYVVLLYQFHLFGYMTVNFYYLIMSIYGWIHWLGKDANQVEIPITRTTKKEYVLAAILFASSSIFVCLVYAFMAWKNGTAFENLETTTFGSTFWIDTFTTSVFFVGMWLMAKRKLEHWIFWIIGDFLVIPMFMYKGLAITSIQYVGFLVLAIYGLLNWYKILKKNNS